MEFSCIHSKSHFVRPGIKKADEDTPTFMQIQLRRAD